MAGGRRRTPDYTPRPTHLRHPRSLGELYTKPANSPTHQPTPHHQNQGSSTTAPQLPTPHTPSHKDKTTPPPTKHAPPHPPTRTHRRKQHQHTNPHTATHNSGTTHRMGLTHRTRRRSRAQYTHTSATTRPGTHRSTQTRRCANTTVSTQRAQHENPRTLPPAPRAHDNASRARTRTDATTHDARHATDPPTPALGPRVIVWRSQRLVFY